MHLIFPDPRLLRPRAAKLMKVITILLRAATAAAADSPARLSLVLEELQSENSAGLFLSCVCLLQHRRRCVCARAERQ